MRSLQKSRSHISVHHPHCLPELTHHPVAWYALLAHSFDTAVEESQRALLAAKVEASSARNGIGLVKLMGRQSGFIAMQASMASGVVDAVLIPEVRQPWVTCWRGDERVSVDGRRATGWQAVVAAETGMGGGVQARCLYFVLGLMTCKQGRANMLVAVPLRCCNRFPSSWTAPTV